ncbi:MAG: branched-chain amino acid ABC transporter permease [Xanthobacteraceae bacterium]|nr:branched-chain amino acid ABC transporter permease [Xanthobacteraceae bacterium]
MGTGEPIKLGLGESHRRGRHFAVATATRASTVTLFLAVPGIVVLLALPAFASRVLLQELFYVFTMLALAQLWNLLAGSAGLISVGQQAFVGMGAYALFACTVVANLDPVLSIVLAGAIAGLVAIPAALIVFRLRGAYFAIGTWVVAEVCRLILAQVKQLGGGTGTSLPPDVASSMVGLDFVRNLFAVRGPAARDILSYWLALTLAVGTFFLVYRLLRSRHGLALSAIGDSETAAESTGVDVFRTKLFIYVATAAATGMVGALIFLQKARISPDAAFSLIDWTAYVIFIVVIGGIGTMEGPIIGVVIFYLLQYYLASLGSWYLILLGGLAIVLMLFAPAGVWGLISRFYDISPFPVRRRLIVRVGKVADEKESKN